MKTLVTVWKKELRELLFPDQVRRQLEAITEVNWVPEDQPYTVEQLGSEISRYQAVITSWRSPKLTAEVLEQAKSLRFIGHAAGTLVPYVDASAFERPELVVVNSNTALARSTAELTLSLMLTGAWSIGAYQDKLRGGSWSSNEQTVMGVYGQAIGIVGLGEIAREVIRLLKGFDAKIRLYSPYCTPEEAALLGVQLCSLEEVFRHSRIVTLHDTLTEATRGMIDRKLLGLLPNGALLINTARGPLIDEEALRGELNSGRIQAALDVYHKEPLPPEDPLLHLPNVICLPHIGAYSGYWKSQLGVMVVEDLTRFASGQETVRRITAEKFTRMTRS